MLKFLLSIVFGSLLFGSGTHFTFYSSETNRDSIIAVFNNLQAKKPSKFVVDEINALASNILQKDYIQALSFSKKSLVLAEHLGYDKGKAEALLNIGSSFNSAENYTLALQQIERASLLANKIKDPFLLAKINNTKGMLLLNIGYYDEALKIFNKSLQNLKKIDPKHTFTGAVLHNVGFLYLKKDNNLKAIQFFDESISHDNHTNSKVWLAKSYFERAVAYKNLSNYNQAKTDVKVSIKLSEQINDFTQIVTSLNLLSNIYINFNDYKKADQLLKKGMELSIQHNLSQQKLAIFKSLSRLAEEKDDYKKGYLIEKSYNKLYDSLYNKDRYRQLDEFRVYYGARQKDNENIALKKANLKKEIKIQNKNYFLLAFVILLILTAYLLWMIFKRGKRMDKSNTILTQQNEEINRHKKELEELNQWKSKFFSIVSHDLRSPILSLKGMLELFHSKLLNEEELKLFMKELNKNFRNTASLMDNLLMWAKSQMQGQTLYKKEIDIYQITKDNIEVLQQNIDEKKLNFRNNIHLRFAYADEESISIVIRNLIANAIKFSNQGNDIMINSEKKDNNLVICIKDNGVGMSSEQVTKVLSRVFYTTNGTKEEKGTGLGILLCDEFVRKNGGKFWIESILGDGSSFYFSLPLKK